MKHRKVLLYIIFFSVICSQTHGAEYLPNQATRVDSSLNILRILTDQQTHLFQPYDIDGNQKIHIPEALYPLMIQSNMIAYELHHNNDTLYLLKNGKTFASIIKITENTYFVIHPDAHPTHHGFLWSVIPFITTKNNSFFNIKKIKIR